MTTFRALLALTVATAPRLATAETWVSTELPAAVAVSDAQAHVFRPGAMPAVGAYTRTSLLSFGLRLRAGVLRDGPAIDPARSDPNYGGLATLSMAARVHVGRTWVELAGGAGITGRDVAPTIEAGLGLTFDVAGLDVGPSARWVRVVGDRMDAFGSADLLVAGLDVRWGTKVPARARPVARVATAPRVLPRPWPDIEPIVIERDRDRVAEREAGCARDLDGCPITDSIRMVNDRIILDERVLFAFGRARVRSSGRAVLHAIGDAWRAHPEWKRIRIEGHADVRGTDELNQALSERRADHTRRVLLELGFESERIEAVGFGRARPRIDARSETQHVLNRRVEFVIERELATEVMQ